MKTRHNSSHAIAESETLIKNKNESMILKAITEGRVLHNFLGNKR